MGKIQRLRSLLQGWGKKKSCTKRELESLLGHLSHAASIVRPGRTFLRQLFSLLRGVKAPSHFVCLNVGARADLKWWECFLQEWCGSSFFPLQEPAHHVFSDASGAYGCGAVVDAESWFQVSWPEEWEAVDISVKELLPVVVAAALWGNTWQGKHIHFHSDNMAVVAILHSRTARNPELMHLLRCFSFYSAHFRFHASCAHVPGAINSAADAISWNNLTLFASLVPEARQVQVQPALFQLLVATRPDWGSPTRTQLFSRSLAETLPHPT